MQETPEDEDCNRCAQERMEDNPLIEGILLAAKQVEDYRRQARTYYHQVLLSSYACPTCGGALHMTGTSRCACERGHGFDPTVEFQHCPECGGQLRLGYRHYQCRRCRQVVTSRFLFDERLFSPDYFRERMAESRRRKREKIEELRRLLASSRSGPLMMDSCLSIDAVPGLSLALDEFIGASGVMAICPLGEIHGGFRMEEYRDAILRIIEDCCVRFSALPPVGPDSRRDRARRFITLIYMWQDREVELTQRGADDLLVWKHEVDDEGC